jgi:septum formation protein
MRQKMLEDSGLDCKTIAAGVDEESLKEAARSEGLSTRDAATMLAEMKAAKISNQNSGAYVIGSDQILEFEGRWYSKPEDEIQAVSHLTALSGKTHSLETVAVIYRDGVRIWHHAEVPKISIRTLSPQDIDDYIHQMGEKISHTPGVYMMEYLGAQIISKIDGCPYAVLGLPLLQLLDFLRGHGLTLKRV